MKWFPETCVEVVAEASRIADHEPLLAYCKVFFWGISKWACLEVSSLGPLDGHPPTSKFGACGFTPKTACSWASKFGLVYTARPPPASPKNCLALPPDLGPGAEPSAGELGGPGRPGQVREAEGQF